MRLFWYNSASPSFLTGGTCVVNRLAWQMVLTAILTAFAGEFKIVPFSGEEFRFGLGASIFFLLLLLTSPNVYMRTGVVTGLTVVLYRIIEDQFRMGNNFSLLLSFKIQAPAFLFYVFFAVALRAIRVENYRLLPFRLGGVVTIIDFTSNTIEQITRSIILGRFAIDPMVFVYFIAVAALRSFFVVGLYSSIALQHFRVVHTEQKKRLEQMLSVSSGLYAETLYLQKSMENIEQITAQGYDLYRKLKEQQSSSLSRQALAVAQQIHEVKKDSQRILAGLLKLFDQDVATKMTLSEIAGYVVESNRKYSAMIQREVAFETEVRIDYTTKSYVPLLTILGNLVSNAVEAVPVKGEIRLTVSLDGDETWFTVYDNGKGIAEHDFDVIFEPGYTTKFNDDGVASTGIGLSHVQDIVRSLDGDITVQSDQHGTGFNIRIPTKSLKVEE
jgi:two-component system, sensor histidine kinase YcbA